MTIRTRLGSVVVLGVALVLQGCVSGVDGEELVGESEQALINGGYWMGDSNGKLYSDNSPKNWEGVTTEHIWSAMAASEYSDDHQSKFVIIDWADGENRRNLGGDAARSRYGASGAWCTEYTRWVFRSAGADNIRYCKRKVLGICTNWIYLSEADTVSDMIELFKANSGWVNEADITASRVAPGDYVALRGCDGDRLGHSGIVMAISSDNRWIYTSEGNRCGDRVGMQRRPFIVDGSLHRNINGIGHIAVAF